MMLNGEKVELSDLKKMNDLLIHRGPDDEGFFIHENCGIAMRRLSIIDLTTGRQPILNETEDIAIVFNGEIYNYQEIREELVLKGHIFKTRSDTETIIHLYEETGIDFVKKLRGMFAIAILDIKNKRLILTRDRLGKKPLFYSYTNKYFAFSSEIDSLISFKEVKRSVNLKAVDTFLTLQYIPAPMSIYSEVKKLEQATAMVLESGELKTYKYWEVPKDQIDIDFEDAKIETRRLVTDAVKLRMISDVEIGAFLSGGIDSSIVVGLMAQNSSKAVKTFSIGFKEEKFNELEYAREIAKRYSTDHSEFIVEGTMTQILDNLVSIYNQPFADPSALPTYFVSKITAKNVKVALNGDGGDENFAGYQRYVATKAIFYLDKFTPDFVIRIISKSLNPLQEKNAPFGVVWKMRKLFRTALKDSIEKGYLATLSFFDIDDKNEMLSDEFKKILGDEINYAQSYILGLMSELEDKDITKKMTYADLNSYLSECLMTKMDMAAMSNSLETRSPFLDHKLVEFVQRLPSEYKLKGFNKTKFILKETFEDIIGGKIKKRGKMGFSIPLGIWFRGELKNKFEEYCLSDKAIKRGYFNKKSLRMLWDEHQSLKRDNGYKLWAILMLELWHRRYANDFKL